MKIVNSFVSTFGFTVLLIINLIGGIVIMKHTRGHWVYAKYVIRNGRIIYPRRARVLRFWVNK